MPQFKLKGTKIKEFPGHYVGLKYKSKISTTPNYPDAVYQLVRYDHINMVYYRNKLNSQDNSVCYTEDEVRTYLEKFWTKIE